jgi:hypothetical protein
VLVWLCGSVVLWLYGSVALSLWATHTELRSVFRMAIRDTPRADLVFVIGRVLWYSFGSFRGSWVPGGGALGDLGGS